MKAVLAFLLVLAVADTFGREEIRTGSPIADLVRGAPRLVLYCPSPDCLRDDADVKLLAENYPAVQITTVSPQGSGATGKQLYSVGSGIIRRNEAELARYARLELLPISYQLTAELMSQLTTKKYDKRLLIAVFNASSQEHLAFYQWLLELAPKGENIGYIDIEQQFDFAYSLEVYKRHCPTVIAFDPLTSDLRLPYVRLGSNSSETKIAAIRLIESLRSGEVKSVRQGLMNFHTKLGNMWYVYHNFHTMLNYAVGAMSVLVILALLVCEKHVLKAMGGRSSAPPPAPQTAAEKSQSTAQAADKKTK